MGLPTILVGGVLIIDLSTLSITPSVDMETYTTISNSEILSQLAKLKQYIGNPTAQKPLWVRMSYDGEMITTMGALYKEVGDPHFKLVIKVMDYRLVIDVTFTQDEETLEWYIDTGDAKYLFTSNSQEVDSYISDSISSGAIKSALDLKADLSGATFTGGITAPSGSFETINSETNPSVKPIYYHPIFITDYSTFRITMVIIDNSPTQYTWTTLKAKIKELMDNNAKIQANGYYKIGTELYNVFMINKSVNNYYIYCNGTDFQNNIDIDSLDVQQLDDGVNKIN